MGALTIFISLTIVTCFCAGLTIGLTFLPCYSSLCTEEFFPVETRIHIAFFYSLLASIAAALSLRTISDTTHRISRTYLLRTRLSLLKKRLSIGGLALLLSIVLLTIATTGYWYPAEHAFWLARGQPVSWTAPMPRIAWTGITGHWCDILLGLLIIPISRNSFIGRVFRLHVETLLFAHKMLAYGLLLFAAVHGGWYFSFVAAFAAEQDGARKTAFNIDNPTVSYADSDPWSFAVLPSGMGSWVLTVVITITALPVLRRRSYNTFYYTHLICSAVIFIATCIHASTDFYCLLPGLLLWIFDWGWRVCFSLRKTVDAEVENAGNGWIRIRLPTGVCQGRGVDGEKAIHRPLQSYYINFPSVSRIQLHAFTAAGVGTAEHGPVFLLQRSAGKKQKKLDKEWTWKLAALVADAGTRKSLAVRIEGPYTPPAQEMYEAKHILCIVGGTGITGALCLADWWSAHRAQERDCSFRLVWTLRLRTTAEIAEVQVLRLRIDDVANMDFMLHVTSEDGRIDPRACVDNFLGATLPSTDDKAEVAAGKRGPAWVYCSGPEGLLASTEDACIDVQKRLRKGRKQYDMSMSGIDRFDWYIARWSL